MNSARIAIQAAYDNASYAANRHDIQGVLAHYAPDFIGITHSGRTINSEQNQQNISKFLALLQRLKSKTVIKKISIKHNVVTVVVEEHGTAVLVTDQSRLRLVEVNVSKDTWIKSQKGWLEKQSKELYAEQTINKIANIGTERW